MSLNLQDAPNAVAFARFPNLAETTFAIKAGKDKDKEADIGAGVVRRGQRPRPGFAIDNPDNVIDRVDRTIDSSTWLVARRKGAGLSRNSTEVLTGVRSRLRLEARALRPPRRS